MYLKLSKDVETLKELNIVIPEWRIVLLKYGVIAPSSSVITLKGRAPIQLRTSEKMYNTMRFKTIRELRSFLFREKSSYESAFYIYDMFQGSYFHWFCDILPRILYFKNNYPTERILLQECVQEQKYIVDSLAFYQIDPVWIAGGHGVFVKKLYLVVTDPNDRTLQKYPLSLIRSKVHFLKPEKKIFISRAKATKRRLTNEEEVFEELKSIGFEKFFLEEMTFDEQRKLFSRAYIVVAPHGAGLTNMIFSPVGTLIVELLPTRNFEIEVFRHLAVVCGHKYECVQGSCTTDHDSDYSIPMSLIHKKISQLN